MNFIKGGKGTEKEGKRERYQFDGGGGVGKKRLRWKMEKVLLFLLEISFLVYLGDATFFLVCLFFFFFFLIFLRFFFCLSFFFFFFFFSFLGKKP